MDIRDLRIGDIVTTNGKTYGTKKGELYIITKIDSEVKETFKDGTHLEGGVGILDIKRDFYRYIGGAWIDYLIPIHITDELLLILGFDKHDYSDLGLDIEYELATLKGFISVSNVSNSKDRDYSVQIDNIAHTSIGGMDIQYLHELQHIIWDCLKNELKTK